MDEITQMIEMLEVMIDKIAESENLINGIAKFTNNLFCAFIAQGFDRDEAMQLTIAALRTSGKK